jgi:hypothetical protein
MPGGQPSLFAADFSAIWCGTGLGEYRTGRGYERYPYQSLPPLDYSQFAGAFQSFGRAGDLLPGQISRLSDLATDLMASGLGLGDGLLDRYIRAAAQSG